MKDRSWFEDYREPSMFVKAADILRQELNEHGFLVESGGSWRREAWLLGKFAVLQGANWCRLLKEDPPDGIIVKSNQEILIGITEFKANSERTAVKLSRILNHDKNKFLEEELDEDVIWDPTEEILVDELIFIINKKKSKNYNAQINLLIYFNHSNFKYYNNKMIESSFYAACEKSRANFPSIYLLLRDIVFVYPKN
ncbi:hypothetical protein [Rhabdaerophilum sp.]|uniref:hypothetical protein n=1 Tax=Rhabdaerophilum sp. TaxID=2717341 RepID=UPI0038D44BD5